MHAKMLSRRPIFLDASNPLLALLYRFYYRVKPRFPSTFVCLRYHDDTSLLQRLQNKPKSSAFDMHQRHPTSRLSPQRLYVVSAPQPAQFSWAKKNGGERAQTSYCCIGASYSYSSFNLPSTTVTALTCQPVSQPRRKGGRKSACVTNGTARLAQNWTTSPPTKTTPKTQEQETTWYAAFNKHFLWSPTLMCLFDYRDPFH